MSGQISSLERILTVLDGEIPDRIPSVCIGADYDFIDRFMKSPYAITDEDIAQFDKHKISYDIPCNHAIIAKFTSRDYLPGGLDAKIDLCWQIAASMLPVKLDAINDYITDNGGLFRIVIRESGIPHWWYAGPALVNKESMEEYWSLGRKLIPDKSAVNNFAKTRKKMLKKYDIVVAQGVSGPFENCTLGIGLANLAYYSKKNPSLLQQHIDFQWETIEKPLLKMLFDTKPQIVMCGDDYGFNFGLQMPAKDWRKFIKPVLADYVKMTHDAGGKFILHSCGDLHEIFPDFVEIGIDGVESLKPKNNDLKMYREKYPEITLLGTIDDSEMLKYENPNGVRESVKESIKLLGKKGGYIPGATNFLLDQPPENVVALYRSIQDYGRY